MFSGLLKRLKALLRPGAVDDEISEELRLHVDSRAAQLRAQGVDAADAEAAARRELGNLTAIREQSRDALGIRFIQDAVLDLKYAVRTIARSPLASVVIVATVAVGAGANTAIFGVLDALAFRTLPVPHPDRLLLTWESPISHSQYLQLRERSPHFAGLAAIWTIDRYNLATAGADSGGVDEARAHVGLASANYFSTLGVPPAIGRVFADDEDRVAGERAVAVLSDAYWHRRFAGSSDIVGQAIRLNGISYEVIGVMPRGFTGEWVGMPTDLWVPFSMASKVMPEVPGGPGRFPRRVIARVADGIAVDQARERSDVLYRQILREEAGAGVSVADLEEINNSSLNLQPGSRGYSPQRRSFSQPLAILAGGVALLLLIACANLANLLLARSAARQRELAVRVAIGASRWRLARQLLTEAMLLSGAGAFAGVVLAIWMQDVLAAMIAAAPVSLAGTGTGLILGLGINLRLLVFAVFMCLAAGVMFGLPPAFSASRVAPAGVTSSRIVGDRRFGPSTVLVVAQVAVSLLLLVGAGLFLRTLANLRGKDLGFGREHQLLVWTVPGQTGRQDDAMADLWTTVQQRLARLPGVVSVAASNQSMLRGTELAAGRAVVFMRVDGEPPKPVSTPAGRSFVTPGFFATLGIPIVAGRDVTERDTETSPRVVIINETMARFYFGNRNPIGRIVSFPPAYTPTEVVGVAADFVRGTPRGSASAEFAQYFPYRDREGLNRGAQTRLRVMLIVLRTAGAPLAVAGAVRQELRAIDPALPIIRINTVDQQREDVLAQDRMVAVLSAAFGGLAVFLACLGVFGLISHRVTRRTNEIGVRLALGATRSGICRMVLLESGRLVGGGLLLGLVSALLLGPFVASRLYGVAATDLATLAAASGIILGIAAFAAFIPARRAATVDPMAALREIR